jgi:type IV secretory pathway TrbL component
MYINLEVIIAVLIFINLMTLVVIVLIGGAIMDALNQAIVNLNNQITAVQEYVKNLKGQTVDPAALSSAVDSINKASSALGSLTQG